MSFLIRRLSLRRRSPPGNQDGGATLRNDDGIRPDSSVQPQPQPPSTAPRQHFEIEVANDQDAGASHYSTAIDVYEDRMDEFGQLMQEQGRCIDELTNRSRRMSTENAMLRERLSGNLALKPVALSPIRSPLKNITNNSEHTKLKQKFNDENALLIQQADLLTTEIMDANKLLAERDASIASLGKELSSCLEKARMCKRSKISNVMFSNTRTYILK